MSGGRAGNGRSSIYKEDKGVWHGWVTMGRDESGKSVRRHVRGKNATEVGEKVAQLEAQRTGAAGRSAVAARVTVGDWIDEWLRIILRSRTPRTDESYESLVRIHCRSIRRIEADGARAPAAQRARGAVGLVGDWTTILESVRRRRRAAGVTDLTCLLWCRRRV